MCLISLILLLLLMLFPPDVRSSILGWSEKMEIAHKLLSLLNSYTPPDVHKCCRGKIFDEDHMSFGNMDEYDRALFKLGNDLNRASDCR